MQADAAPPLARLGIPAYNWLNDDVHGVASGDGTIFPNGTPGHRT
jgi:predicted lipoprotein with Yx(FWY)xxD motif